MIVAAWNVRGMNNPVKTKEVRDFLEVNNISVMGLLETKIKRQNAGKLQKKLGNKWNWSTNYDHHDEGRISVGWRTDRFKMETCNTHPQFIVTKITSYVT